MYSKLAVTLLFATVALAKDVIIQNNANQALTVSVSGKDNVVVWPHIPSIVTLEDNWSGKISACQGECNGNVRSEATLTLGTPVDQYSVSLVNGFNVPIKIVPINGANCDAAVCGADINKLCPLGNEVVNDLGQVVACQNSPLVFAKVCPNAIVSESEEAAKTLSCNAISYRIILG